MDEQKPGQSRLQAIETYLNSVEEFGDAEELLLIEWLQNTDEEPVFEYQGDICHKDVRFDIDKSHRIVGLSYSIYGMSPYDECDESLGTFVLKLFGWEFEHFGVTRINRGWWSDSEWSTPGSRALGEALDVYTLGFRPYVEDFIEEQEAQKCDVEAAIASLIRRESTGPYSDVRLLFCLDGELNVYVFPFVKKFRKGLEDEEPTPYWDGKQPPENLSRVSQDIAVSVLLKAKLPFDFEI